MAKTRENKKTKNKTKQKQKQTEHKEEKIYNNKGRASNMNYSR